MRIGEALGLRHADIAAAERQVTVVARRNANRARSKSRESRTIPVSAELIRLWGDYLHTEYGDVDSDYVFVNLFAEPRGQALAYPAVYDLVLRLRRRTGIDFDPHWCRHSMATRALRDGGWQVEYSRDVWRLRNLGIAHRNTATITFEVIGHQADQQGRPPGRGPPDPGPLFGPDDRPLRPAV